MIRHIVRTGLLFRTTLYICSKF